jgi:hypothetical protein
MFIYMRLLVRLFQLFHVLQSSGRSSSLVGAYYF